MEGGIEDNLGIGTLGKGLGIFQSRATELLGPCCGNCLRSGLALQRHGYHVMERSSHSWPREELACRMVGVFTPGPSSAQQPNEKPTELPALQLHADDNIGAIINGRNPLQDGRYRLVSRRMADAISLIFAHDWRPRAN